MTAPTSYNSGHTATLRSAQIGSLRSPTSYVRETLCEIAGDGLEIMKEVSKW